MATRMCGQHAAFGISKEGPTRSIPRERPVYERMAALLREAPVIRLTDDSRVVVFSDLHMSRPAVQRFCARRRHLVG